MPTEEELGRGFRIGEWDVLPGRGVMRRGDDEERPEPLVMRLLIALAKRDGDLVTHDELVDELWGGRAIGDTPITRAVYQLRKHLGDRERPFTYVETLQRRGYRLMRDVELLDQEPRQEPSSEVDADSGSEWRSSPALRGLVIGVIIVLAASMVWMNNRGTGPDCTSIAVLPFENFSRDPEQQYLSYGFREELVRSLHTVPNLCVITANMAGAGSSIVEIADRLGVDNVLSGGVQRVEDLLKVNYELTDRRAGAVLKSNSLTGDISELFDLQVKVAQSVREDLFPGAGQFLVSASRPSNFDAYNAYLQGLYAFERRGGGSNFVDAQRLFADTIDKDPDFGPAYLQLATATALEPIYLDSDDIDSSSRAVEIAEQGVAVDASIEAAAGAVYGYIYHKRKEWADAELAYERATTARVVDSNAFIWYSRMLASVGRLDASLEQALKAWQMDPDNAVINSRVAMAYSWLGEAARAREFYERANLLGAEGPTHLLSYALFLSSQDEIAASNDVAKFAAAQAGIPEAWIDAVLLGMQDSAATPQALLAVNDAVTAGYLSPQVEVVTRTLLGDIDGAMRVARLLEQPGEAFEMDLLWIPQFLPLRQHPEFLDLMNNIGVTAYWGVLGCKFDNAAVSCPG
ncbi:MAG: winged helix-turn-helix domain-containing protein [Woeseiaceae bacterium]|nr:winged helix-turn-helix domain-containing protein [Woeseiaceae bacterium]